MLSSCYGLHLQPIGYSFSFSNKTDKTGKTLKNFMYDTPRLKSFDKSFFDIY